MRVRVERGAELEEERGEDERGLSSKGSADKPPFHLPSMPDVERARGSAGLTLVSTFAGCGGSCLGFEMAGFRTLWANEFIDAARDTYAANHPGVILDGRDIREVSPEEILEAIGLARGELDVLNGSPPCASFSSAGSRSKGWGKVKTYSDKRQRVDDLFFEFVRILDGLKPRAFVAENVAGLTRGVALGYFKEIMRALDAAGYRVRCKVLDAQWLDVPQSRPRAIFVGVRKDLTEEPEHPRPRSYRYTLREVLPGLARIYQAPSGAFRPEPIEHIDRPASTIIADHRGRDDWKVIERVVHDTSGQWSQGDVTDRPCPTIMNGMGAINAVHFKVIERSPQALSPKDEERWRTRKLARSRQWGDPKIIRVDPSEPMPAVLTSPDMFAHSTEPRRFTIDELRIICGFPADFVLTGTYAQQWERLGRAVPPPMMRAVAGTLRDGLFTRLGRTRPGFIEAR